MTTQHRLERRARLLGQRMADASTAMAKQMGAGERPPFTTAQTRSEALAWWRAHRDDTYGAQALERLKPWEIAQLDADLGAYVNGEVPSGQ